MQKMLVILTLLASACTASAQTSTAAQPTGWARVQAQAPGTTLQIKATKQSATCTLKSVTEAGLICTKGVAELTFAPGEIRRVRVPHRGRSTLVGFGIGAGAGAVAGLGINAGTDGFITKKDASGVLAAIFGVIGAGVGAATDFTHTTIYSTK